MKLHKNKSMCKSLKIVVTFDSIPSKKVIEEHVKIRLQTRPDHLRGAEVQKIANEMNVTPMTIYRILKK